MYDIPRLLSLLEIDAKRQGREYHALCPLHQDRNPSFQVQAETGLFHCWSCGEGGTAITLVAKVLRIDYFEARAWLKANGVEGELNIVCNLPVKVGGGFLGKPKFRTLMADVIPCNYTARQYLKTRGITEEQINKWYILFGIGGQVNNRVVFPILDRDGRECSFMARTIIGARPRYTTPHPNLNPDRDVIFGERYWPDHEGDCQIVVTEGAFNALACERAGATYIAALGGSNLGLTVYAKLAKFKRVIVASDPDKAGERVATALKVLQRWTDVTRVALPPGLDAADLSTDALRSRLIAAGLETP